MKNNIVVVGPVELQETVKVNSKNMLIQENDFSFWGIDSYVGGHGFNITKVMGKLGRTVDFISLIGKDIIGDVIFSELIKCNISTKLVDRSLEKSSQTIIAYDKGFRKFFIDLKDVQQTNLSVDYVQTVSESDIVIASNINYARPVIEKAKELGKTIAVDIHDQNDVEDEYNKFFMENADILFMSNEKIVNGEKDFLKQLIQLYDAKIIVIGMGNKGALMYDKKERVIYHYMSQNVTNVNCIFGTGDAFFASFMHFYCKNASAGLALDLAMTFAENGIQYKGPGTGLLTEDELLNINRNRKYKKEVL